MRVIVQRVTEASVEIEGQIHSRINKGFMVLVGFEQADDIDDIEWISRKITSLRIFGDDQGRMNLDISDTHGEILVVSQFTLHASTKKGNRPSFIKAAHPDHAIPLYESFINSLKELTGNEVKSGQFGAYMKVRLLNDGPVTIVIDSKNRE